MLLGDFKETYDSRREIPGWLDAAFNIDNNAAGRALRAVAVGRTSSPLHGGCLDLPELRQGTPSRVSDDRQGAQGINAQPRVPVRLGVYSLSVSLPR